MLQVSDKECYSHTEIELSLQPSKEARSTDERKRVWHSNTREMIFLAGKIVLRLWAKDETSMETGQPIETFQRI